MLDSRPQLTELLIRVGSQDRAAFDMVYRATSAKLYGVVLRILRRHDVAQDVLQAAYVKIWIYAKDFDAARGSPIAWMVSIARNTALDEIRRAAPISLEDTPAAYEVHDPLPLADQALEHSEDARRLAACLDKLTPERRDLVRLAYLEGLSREELAQRTGSPVSTVKTWLHRSLKQLKDCLAS
jgi:RNA polymerase sigma-70 factor, ECF subfamily